MPEAPKSLIINSPYDTPDRFWTKQDTNLELAAGRRPAGYELYDIRNNTLRVEPLPLVNQIRERVGEWRADGYPGVTSVTRRLLEHWTDGGARQYPFYFCQLEAIETLIWRVEGAARYRQGIQIPGDGGPWERLCCKMATGSGKTTVMAMIVTWQVLNAITYPKRKKDFSRAVFFAAPGITVKERLRVLYPGDGNNYYDIFQLCPSEALRQKLNQAEILIENWHSLMPKKEPTRSVVRKGPESDEAYTRRVLKKLATYRDILVINDEAHHAYRKPAEVKISKKRAAEQGIDLDEATRWIEGLDRIHKTRRILRCFDLSATPFAPTGKASTEQGLFGWVISDFGLNDAIETGLVKTPRVVVRDDALPDAKTYRSKLYHIYRDPSVSEDLNQPADAAQALPKLVQDAYTLLGADWREAHASWRAAGHKTPPVMLTVCNRTETAARIEHYFRHGDAHWPELHEPLRTLRVDSKVLEKAEVGEKSTANRDYENRLREIVAAADIQPTVKTRLATLSKEELLREIVDNVGKHGTPGQDLQNVISVAMLSEGWDAKNVTHIMGLRAFTSQLLCEQVIGRGLRRVGQDMADVTGEDGITRRLYEPEYVNVFGVPLSIFQDVGGGEPPPPPSHLTQIRSVPERAAMEIRWPNILRVDTVVRPTLTLDWSSVEPLKLDPAQTIVTAEIAPALDGIAHLGQIREIDLEKIPEGFRLQHQVFRAVRKAFESMRGRFRGTPEYLTVQLIGIIELFFGSDRLEIPSLFHQDPFRKRILFALNLDPTLSRCENTTLKINQLNLIPIVCF